MPAKFQKYPVYVYDEPVSYEDFTGGINTDPSNEHLTKNELRDCVNMHYLSGALVKRKGAKEIAKLISEVDLFNIQGIFLFTYRITYIVVAADGKLYYGIYNENTDILLTRLRIFIPTRTSSLVYDPQSIYDGLEEKTTEDIHNRHEGFIHSFEINNNISSDYKYIGDFTKLTNTDIYPNEVVSWNNMKYKYIGEEKYTKRVIRPTDDSHYWEPISPDTAHENNEVVLDWVESTHKWVVGTVVRFVSGSKELFFKCIKEHYNYDGDLIIYDTTNWKLLNEHKELIFQNYRKIEGATFNNNLYIATGTRFTQIVLRNNTLYAEPVIPYLCNNTEINLIGYNYLSPYPEYCRGTHTNTVTTSIEGLLAVKKLDGSYTLEPQMNFQSGDSYSDYLYRWEKKINNKWYVIHTFKSQDPNNLIDSDSVSSGIAPLNTLTVYDAHINHYRVTFAKAFDKESVYVHEWTNSKRYTKGYYVNVNNNTYECLEEHTPTSVSDTGETLYTGKNKLGKEIIWDNDIGEFSVFGLVGDTTVQFWKLIHEQEAITYLNLETNEVQQIYDYAIDKVTGSYFGQATSVLATDLNINDTFNVIQTCTKIHADGNKLLLYGDRYNSGKWFKTIINEPGYITDRGCLSFKTTKNEALLKVIAFQGNIIAFANSDNVGGSIHLVQGNGDDYDSQDGYYSPYRRNTINASISCDNPDTVQICDNLLMFKYFKQVYYINASDLSNDVIQVTSCNDRLIHTSKDVEIPWDDNSCISVVTDTYYALIWKEKYEIDSNGDLILKHPGMRVKMYYKMSNILADNSYTSPWLRDESQYFNVNHYIYIKGKPVFLYNNVLISFDEDYYQDLSQPIPIKIHFRAVDCNYPKVFKLLSNIMVYYHRNQYTKIDFHLESRNEAGHVLIDSSKSKATLQDLKALKADDSYSTSLRLDSTILDTRVINSTYKFPCLLIDTIITSNNKEEFSLSSITYTYTTIDTPENNPYDLYTSIIRKKDLLNSSKFKGGH